jgi:hypothetical protein
MIQHASFKIKLSIKRYPLLRYEYTSCLLGNSLFCAKLSPQLGLVIFDYCDVYFTDFYCLIPTGSNEKINALLRQYESKTIDTTTLVESNRFQKSIAISGFKCNSEGQS